MPIAIIATAIKNAFSLYPFRHEVTRPLISSMSSLGWFTHHHKRCHQCHWERAPVTSAMPPKANMWLRCNILRSGPWADSRAAAMSDGSNAPIVPLGDKNQRLGVAPFNLDLCGHAAQSTHMSSAERSEIVAWSKVSRRCSPRSTLFRIAISRYHDDWNIRPRRPLG